jgi:hypothetical protein
MKTSTIVSLSVLAGAGVGYLAYRALTRKTAPVSLGNYGRANHFDAQFTGHFPRNEGAISAVTGGTPEDMNGMPATASINGPVWDGSRI